MRRLLVALVLTGLGPLAAPLRAAQESPRGWRRAEVELAGPLEGVRLLEPGGGETRLVLAIEEGARLVLPIPLSAAPPALLRLARIEVAGSGRCRLLGIADEGWDATWLDLPLGLRLRTRPPAESARGLPTAVEALVCGAALLGLLAARRRPALVLLGGAAGAIVLVLLPLPEAHGVGVVDVIEGGPGPRLLHAWSAADRLELPPDGPLGLECDAPEAVLRFEVRRAPGGPTSWSVHAPGRRLCALEELAPSAAPPTPAANRLVALEPCWTRSEDGGWSARGAWPLGTPLPPAASAGDPPGWLASGLPQGVGVLIGQAPSVEELLDPAAWRARGPTWVRWLGF